jgi:saposin
VWTNHYVRVDSNPICDDCKDWVKEARDLLAKKQTADEIIKTLEWSCALCPVENARVKCKKIISDNVNEILKMLESKMDPDAICSATHFCNNRELTEIFKNAQQYQPAEKPQSSHLLPFTCGQCNHIAQIIERKFADSSNDEILESLLKMCGKMSSYSDSCSSIIFKNFNDINKQLPKLITKKKMCRASCSQHYENHEGIVDISPAFDDPNIPCELCEQLMLHLREVLIANTTEVEFKNVLEGFCSQIPAITDECISLTEQYYRSIYQYLVDGLDANKTCVAIGICSSKKRF